MELFELAALMQVIWLSLKVIGVLRRAIGALRPAAAKCWDDILHNWPLNWAWFRVRHPFSAEARAQAEFDFGWALAGRDTGE